MHTAKTLLVNVPSICATSITAVKLFVTISQLARGTTSITMVKNGARKVKICPAGEIWSHYIDIHYGATMNINISQIFK